MRGYNCVQLIGNATKDVECKTSNSGTEYVRFSIAVSNTWTDRQTGEKKESVQYIDLTAFGATARIAGQYVKRGTPIFVKGSLSVQSKKNDAGENRTYTSVKIDELLLLSSGSGQGNQPRQQPSRNMEPSIDSYFPDSTPPNYGGAGGYSNRPMPATYTGNTQSAPKSLRDELMGIDTSLDFNFGANVSDE